MKRLVHSSMLLFGMLAVQSADAQVLVGTTAPTSGSYTYSAQYIPTYSAALEAKRGTYLGSVNTTGFSAGAYSSGFINNIPNPNTNPNTIPQQLTGASYRSNAPNAQAPIQKPFANASNRPTVSPYLNLYRRDSSETDYFNLVRPQLEANQFQQQQTAQNQQISRQLQEIQQRSAFPVAGSQTITPTGHPTFYRNMGSYYPRPTPVRKAQ